MFDPKQLRKRATDALRTESGDISYILYNTLAEELFENGSNLRSIHEVISDSILLHELYKYIVSFENKGQLDASQLNETGSHYSYTRLMGPDAVVNDTLLSLLREEQSVYEHQLEGEVDFLLNNAMTRDEHYTTMFEYRNALSNQFDLLQMMQYNNSHYNIAGFWTEDEIGKEIERITERLLEVDNKITVNMQKRAKIKHGPSPEQIRQRNMFKANLMTDRVETNYGLKIPIAEFRNDRMYLPSN